MLKKVLLFAILLGSLISVPFFAGLGDFFLDPRWSIPLIAFWAVVLARSIFGSPCVSRGEITVLLTVSNIALLFAVAVLVGSKIDPSDTVGWVFTIALFGVLFASEMRGSCYAGAILSLGIGAAILIILLSQEWDDKSQMLLASIAVGNLLATGCSLRELMRNEEESEETRK